MLEGERRSLSPLSSPLLPSPLASPAALGRPNARRARSAAAAGDQSHSRTDRAGRVLSIREHAAQLRDRAFLAPPPPPCSSTHSLLVLFRSFARAPLPAQPTSQTTHSCPPRGRPQGCGRARQVRARAGGRSSFAVEERGESKAEGVFAPARPSSSSLLLSPHPSPQEIRLAYTLRHLIPRSIGARDARRSPRIPRWTRPAIGGKIHPSSRRGGGRWRRRRLALSLSPFFAAQQPTLF